MNGNQKKRKNYEGKHLQQAFGATIQAILSRTLTLDEQKKDGRKLTSGATKNGELGAGDHGGLPARNTAAVAGDEVFVVLADKGDNVTKVYSALKKESSTGSRSRG